MIHNQATLVSAMAFERVRRKFAEGLIVNQIELLIVIAKSLEVQKRVIDQLFGREERRRVMDVLGADLSKYAPPERNLLT